MFFKNINTIIVAVGLCTLPQQASANCIDLKKTLNKENISLTWEEVIHLDKNLRAKLSLIASGDLEDFPFSSYHVGAIAPTLAMIQTISNKKDIQALASLNTISEILMKYKTEIAEIESGLIYGRPRLRANVQKLQALTFDKIRDFLKDKNQHGHIFVPLMQLRLAGVKKEPLLVEFSATEKEQLEPYIEAIYRG